MKATHNDHRRVHRLAISLAVVGLAAGAFGGCDFLNPTRVDNPRTTAEDLAQAEEPTKALLPGLRAQFAAALGAVVTTTENVSDNYSIQGTGLSQELDEPHDLTPDIGALNTSGGVGAYFNLQELRSLADFVIDDIAPNDPKKTDAQLAEAHYYRGMALLMLGENFAAVPVVEDGPARGGDELLALGVTDLTKAIDLSAADGTFLLPARAGLARAYRLLGDANNAAAAATAVLAADPAFLFSQPYDATSIENMPHVFLVLRALQEMQPLPRLDFLDPKFTSSSAAIAVAKAEEMHLILAEVAMSRSDLGEAKTQLAQAIELARDPGLRPRAVDFDDIDLRKNGDLTLRPRESDFLVAADPASGFRAGLVLDRPGAIDVPTVSHTSLNADSVRALPAADTEAVHHALYLARQEILFLEGRRMSDLGIRLPMMLREIDANPNIAPGDPGTRVEVPTYIPNGGGLDAFTPRSPYECDTNSDVCTRTTDRITIAVDMNRVLATNSVSPFSQ